MEYQRGEEATIWQLDWIRPFAYFPVNLLLMVTLLFQVLEGKSRRGERINKTIQFNPFEKKWEIYDETVTEDRHQLVKELLKMGCVTKYEDLKEILNRSISSSERYLKQAIDSGAFSELEWKEWKQKAKLDSLTKDERIKKRKKAY